MVLLEEDGAILLRVPLERNGLVSEVLGKCASGSRDGHNACLDLDGDCARELVSCTRKHWLRLVVATVPPVVDQTRSEGCRTAGFARIGGY